MRIAILCWAVLLAACSSTPSEADLLVSLQKQDAAIDHATLGGITLDSTQQAAPSVTGTATGAQAQDIFTETIGLAPPPSGPESCPDDGWARYVAVFYAGTTTVAAITLDPVGCEIVEVSSAQGDAALTAAGAMTNYVNSQSTYWDDLAAAFGLGSGTLGPTAPQPPTAP